MRVVSAVSFLLALCALQALAADVVVLRDGSQRSGRVESCADDACRLSGARIAMSEIAAIFLNGDDTLQQTIPATPNVVVMRDGSVRKGVVTFINLGVVEIGDEELERSEVAAIIFGTDPRRTVKPVSDVVILRDRSSIVDLDLHRDANDVGIDVVRREGELQIIAVKWLLVESRVKMAQTPNREPGRTAKRRT